MKECEECYSINNRSTPILNPRDCLENHLQYICGTCGRCICVNRTEKSGLQRWNFPFKTLETAKLYLRSADICAETNCGIYEIKNEKGIANVIGTIFGDPLFLGLILGAVFGIIAQYDVPGILEVTMKTAGIMVLFPNMVKLIVNGLIPISNQAKKFFATKFKDRELYIGLDSVVTIGHPVTISVGMLMIPVFMIFAAILPGNTTLPLGEVPFAAFYVCFATIIHRGNRLRTIVSSVIFIPIVLWISSWAAPLFTQLADSAGLSFVQEGQQATTMALGNFGIWFPTMIAQIPTVGPILLVAVILVVIFGGKMIENKRSAEETSATEKV